MDFFNLFYKFDNTLEKVKKPLYFSLIFLIYFSYFLIFAGLYYVNTNYIHIFSILLQIFVCAFLIIRFHPFRKHELREFDASIIFASAILLLTNAGLTEFAKKDLEALAKYI
jgi:hypothetical protein